MTDVSNSENMFDVIFTAGLHPLLVAFATSFGLCCLFAFAPQLFLKKEHMESDLTARQAQHKRPTPRIGGVGVIAGVGAACLLSMSEVKSDLLMALMAGVVVFLVGLREDIQRDMSPKVRLLAAFVSAAIAISLSGAVMPRFGLPVVDSAIGWVGFGILITILWSAGACHAVNLIDGLNGLASGYSMCAAVGYFAIGGLTGNPDVQFLAAILFVSLFGFFVLNWPFGRLFLGDAGAYAIGHILAWLGIILLVRDPQGAGLAAILVLFWPVADTAFAIIRRRMLDKETDQPDRLHFHHLVVRALRLLSDKQIKAEMLNPVATIVLLPFIAVPVGVGVLFWHNGIAALMAILFFALLFVGTYVVSLDRFKRRKFAVGQLPVVVQEQLQGYAVEISALSGLHVRDSRANYITIFRRSGRELWSLVSSDEASPGIEIYDQFDTDVAAWNYLQEQ